MLKDLDQMPGSLKVAFLAMIVTVVLCLAVIASLQFKIEQGIATLVGTVAGFGLVAWQARIAFGNYTKSQEKQAELDRQAREHKAELDHKAAVLDEIRKKNLLRSAIRAELVSVHHQITEQISTYHIFSVMHDAMHKERVQNTTKGIVFHTIDAPVFKSNIKDIGLLGVSIAADVIKVLSKASGRETKPVDTVIDHGNLATLYKGIIESHKEWAADLIHVAMRIRAFEENTTDPGTLIEEQKRRKAAETQAKK